MGHWHLLTLEFDEDGLMHPSYSEEFADRAEAHHMVATFLASMVEESSPELVPALQHWAAGTADETIWLGRLNTKWAIAECGDSECKRNTDQWFDRWLADPQNLRSLSARLKS